MQWISLPSTWQLEFVRAVLALIINVFCVAGIWVIAYCQWKSAALKVPSHKASTSLLSLYFPSGIGDVVDIIPLLRLGLARKLVWRLSVQGISIVLLTVIAIASAPLAVSSTQLGSEIKLTPVEGVRAKSSFTGITSTIVGWNQTIDRFIKAELPLDQTVDWLPDNRVDWVYNPTEWNSSWSAECQYTEETPITLFSSGNNTGDVFEDVPGVEAALPPGMRNWGRNSTLGKYIVWNSAGSYFGNRFVDMFLWVIIQTNTSLSINEMSHTRHNYLPLEFTVALFHMSGFPANHSTGDPLFGTGPVDKASYVKTTCSLKRFPGRERESHDEDTEMWITNVWTWDLFAISKAYSVFYEPRMSLEAFNNMTITIPTARELFRFYQAYHIVKDTQELSYKTKVIRMLSVRTPTVQLAAPTLGILLAFVISMLAATFYWVFLQKLPKGTSIPRTKVQWMMQGVKEVGGRELTARYLDASWGELEVDLAKARYADVNDMSSHRSYKTIQLGRGDPETEFFPLHRRVESFKAETAYFRRKSPTV